MRTLLLSVLAFSFACAPVRGETKESSNTKLIDALTIPSIPEWTDRYADGKKGMFVSLISQRL